MSATLTTRHQTQIVVSPDSDDEEATNTNGAAKAYVVGPPGLSRSASTSSNVPNNTSGTLTHTPTITTSGPAANFQEVASVNQLSHKYPHTRSTLVGIVREYHPEADAAEHADEADSILASVVQCLKDENEDELKSLLKLSLEIAGDSVSRFFRFSYGLDIP